MKYKTMMRTLMCLVALCMLISCFVGCKKNDEDSAESFNVSTGGDGTHDANGYLLDALPDELDYGGTDISILGWNSEVNEFEVETLNGVPIDEAIFKRNLAIESRLNVNLVFDLTVKGDNGAKNDYAAHVERTIASGESNDIIAAHTGSITTCAIKGLMKDLGAIENSYLDFEKPWWNSSVIEQTKVGDTFFFGTGDISTSLPQMVYSVFFNANIINDLKLDSPYDMVKNNEWTYENMILMGMNVYQDLNEDDKVDFGDVLPLVGYYYDWPALLDGCGIGFVTKDASGAFVLTDSIKGEKSMNVMKKLYDFATLDGAIVGANGDPVRDNFIAGRSLFYIFQSGAPARWDLGASGVEYGCVPIPKYDAEQENYRCAARKPITLFGIPLSDKEDRMQMITAVLECYASEGYRQVTPVIFEQVMKYQKSTSVEMMEMLELIRDTAVFDVGRLYASNIKSLCDQPGYCLRNGTTWENYLNQNLGTIENLLAELSDTLISVAK